MPEGAKIFLAEDDDNIRKGTIALLAKHGHTVVLEASSLKEALEKVELAKEMEVNIAVLDASLSKGGSSSTDGLKIAEALGEEVPGIKIVSFSMEIHLDWGGAHVAHVWKGDFKQLGEIIDRL